MTRRTPQFLFVPLLASLLAAILAPAAFAPAHAADPPAKADGKSTAPAAKAPASAAKAPASAAKVPASAAKAPASAAKAPAPAAKPSASAARPSAPAAEQSPAAAPGATDAAPAETVATDVASDVGDSLAVLRAQAIEAYNRRDWEATAAAADAYRETLRSSDLPQLGADHAQVQFVGGHARFELWRAAPGAFRYDFDEDVIGEMEKSLRIVQDNPFYKHHALGTALYERLAASEAVDTRLEDGANWHLLHALRARSAELRDAPKDGEEFTTFAKYVLQYIGRAFEMARRSPAPEVYLVRVREACRLGFGSSYDDRFVHLYDAIGFDDGNVKAAVLWQAGLDRMHEEGADPDEVLALFRDAAAETRNPLARAEVFRQMADFASRQDDFRYKLEAVAMGRQAFLLDPGNDDIKAQFGTSLHVLSFVHHASGRHDEAVRSAREAVGFEWEGDETAYFDLSRAEANIGDKVNALRHAELAYRKARRRHDEAGVQPFRQNYINILRQFGLTARAQQVEADGQGG